MLNIYDIESQNKMEFNVKSILKKPEDNMVSEKYIFFQIAKICVLFLVIVFHVPFIVADLHYGNSNDLCVNDMPNNLDINLKIYLLVSGFLTLINLIAIIGLIIYIPFENIESYEDILRCTIVFGNISTITHFIWNILGTVVFWAFIYEKNICNSSISTYLFVSLIIKLVGNVVVSLYRYKRSK